MFYMLGNKKETSFAASHRYHRGLIREHVYSGYSRQIEAYSDKICGNCKNNLYKVDKNKTVASCWLMARFCEEGISNSLIRRYQSIKKSIYCRFHCYKNEHTACKYM